MAKLALHGQAAGRARPGLLPAEATSFIGRAGELRQVATALRSARLVTLVGPAGVGKTRVCHRAAALADRQFPDGTWLAELSGLGEPALLEEAIGGALGLAAGDAPARRAAVLDRLRDRRLLLILDNCEHLIDACAAFAEDALRTAPGLTLLVTSRQPLDAQGEHSLQVRPMPAEPDAVELFAQRAAAAAPGFEITSDNRADAVRLCHRLGGLPLAIELAAVRIRALPVRELADRLAAGLSVLDVGRRGATPRHQTLRGAVGLSHRLCGPAEQALWARLSVFRGPFDIGTAVAVCADAELPREEVIGALAGLVDKSVVLRSAGARAGYRLPGPLREFGAGQLGPEDAQFPLLDRLTARCLELAGRGGDQADGHRELLGQYPSVRAALEYALGGERPPGPAAGMAARTRQGAELAVRLGDFWRAAGMLGEGRHWLGRLARIFPAAAVPGTAELARALGVTPAIAATEGAAGTAGTGTAGTGTAGTGTAGAGTAGAGTAGAGTAGAGTAGARRAAGSADALTRRECEIAELVASGLSNREIAGRLFISKRTVDAHLEHIFTKLAISSRVQLTIMLRDPALRLARGTQPAGRTGVRGRGR